jgi:hypothetical protein
LIRFRLGELATQLAFPRVLFLIDANIHANSHFRSWTVDRTARGFIRAPTESAQDTIRSSTRCPRRYTVTIGFWGESYQHGTYVPARETGDLSVDGAPGVKLRRSAMPPVLPSDDNAISGPMKRK